MSAVHLKKDGHTDRKCGMDAPVENSVSRVGLSVPMRCDPEDTQNQEQKQHPELNGHAKKDGVSNRENAKVDEADDKDRHTEWHSKPSGV